MKMFCHIPRENWIVDRMGKEFSEHSSFDVSFDTIDDSTDLIWLLGSWCWDQIPLNCLKLKKVVCTIHHEVPEKFNKERINNFLMRDQFVDLYLTYTEETKRLINSFSKKEVLVLPHWINNNIWEKLNKKECREILNLPENKFIVGSFQRDTEGNDLISPKLEKGPDIFVEKVKQISNFRKDLLVLLGGWRRQYVIKNLQELGIEYRYIELPEQVTVNAMYNALDMYLISSRCEGGPQALFEAGYLKIPILSTPAGQFQHLSKECIYQFEEKINQTKINLCSNKTEENFNTLKSFEIEKLVPVYEEVFKKIKI